MTTDTDYTLFIAHMKGLQIIDIMSTFDEIYQITHQWSITNDF